MNDIYTQVYLNTLNKFTVKQYKITGAILGCLGQNADKVNYKVTEQLEDDPWLAIIQSADLLTEYQLQKWHQYHVIDVDSKNVPYYFVVTKGEEQYIWYSDETEMLPINSQKQKEIAIKIGLQKGLIEDQLDF